MDNEQLMDPEKKSALNKSRVVLCENMISIQQIINHFKSDERMTEYQAEKIMSDRLTSYEKNDQLITWLIKRTNKDFVAFCKALDATKQSHLKNIILKRLPADSVLQATLEAETLSSLPIADTLPSESQGASGGCSERVPADSVQQATLEAATVSSMPISDTPPSGSQGTSAGFSKELLQNSKRIISFKRKLLADLVQQATLKIETLSSIRISANYTSGSHGASTGCSKPGYIVVAGGTIIIDRNHINSKDCYAYSIKTDEWTMLPQMPCPFEDIVTWNGKLYAVGIQSCEESSMAWDPARNKLKIYPIGPMEALAALGCGFSAGRAGPKDSFRSFLRADDLQKNSSITWDPDLRKLEYSLIIMELIWTENKWKYRQDISSTYCTSSFKGFYMQLERTALPPRIAAASVNREDLYLFRCDNNGKHFDKLDSKLQWTKLASPPIDIYSMADLDGILYARSSTDRLYVYNSATDEWSDIAAMRQTMLGVALFALSNSRLYVLGGDDEDRRICESYNPGGNECTGIQPMLRCWNQCASASDGRRLYVVGGLDRNDQLTDDVKVYNPDEDKWTSVAKYPIRIRDAKATFVEELV